MQGDDIRAKVLNDQHVCPYNNNHIIRNQTWVKHLSKCPDKKGQEHLFQECKYNFRHIIGKGLDAIGRDLLEEHYKKCEDRRIVAYQNYMINYCYYLTNNEYFNQINKKNRHENQDLIQNKSIDRQKGPALHWMDEETQNLNKLNSRNNHRHSHSHSPKQKKRNHDSSTKQQQQSHHSRRQSRSQSKQNEIDNSHNSHHDHSRHNYKRCHNEKNLSRSDSLSAYSSSSKASDCSDCLLILSQCKECRTSSKMFYEIFHTKFETAAFMKLNSLCGEENKPKQSKPRSHQDKSRSRSRNKNRRRDQYQQNKQRQSHHSRSRSQNHRKSSNDKGEQRNQKKQNSNVLQNAMYMHCKNYNEIFNSEDHIQPSNVYYQQPQLQSQTYDFLDPHIKVEDKQQVIGKIHSCLIGETKPQPKFIQQKQHSQIHDKNYIPNYHNEAEDDLERYLTK